MKALIDRIDEAIKVLKEVRLAKKKPSSRCTGADAVHCMRVAGHLLEIYKAELVETAEAVSVTLGDTQ